MTQYPEAWLCRELGMAVVNISLITDYDAGVHEGTEAVNATRRPRGLPAERGADPEGRAGPDRAVPGGPRRAGRAGGARPDPRRRARDRRRGHPPVRDGAVSAASTGGGASDRGLPADRSGPSPAGGSRAPGASTRPATPGVWGWDHFMGRGDLDGPGRRGLDALAMAAGATSRITVGSFVLNVMNRHPALVARMASTLQIASGGRLILGIGIGGRPEGARGLRHRVPAAARARRAARGGRRGHPRAVDRRPGHARVAVLPAGRGVRADPVPDPAAADRHRWRDAGRGPAGRPDRRRLDRVRRQLRGEPAALPRGARGGRPAARGPARTSGSRATGCATRRSTTRRGCASPARPGTLARGRRRWRDRPGEDDGRRRPAGGRRRPLVGGRRAVGPGRTGRAAARMP